MDENNKLDELKMLLDKFYVLYGNLFKNRKLLDNSKTYQHFGARIFEQFQIEYQVLKIKFETIENPAIYEARVRHGFLVPRRRFGIFRNRAQKLIDRRVTQEIDEYFRKQNEALERLTDILDNADSAEHRPTVFDEPLDDLDESYNSDVNDVESGEVTSDGALHSTTDETKNGASEKTRQATKQTRKREPRRIDEPETLEQNGDKPNDGQLSGQMSIDEFNENAEPMTGNADKPEQ